MAKLATGQLDILKLIAELPSRQLKISPHPSVSNGPIDKLIIERVFEQTLESTPKASVIISVHHEWTAGTLRALAEQTSPAEDFEVIIVDASESGTYTNAVNELASGLDFSLQLRAFRSVAGGRALANNIGLRLARSPIIIFLADDFVPAQNFVAEHINFHHNTSVVAVGVGGGYFPDELRKLEFGRWMEDSGMLYGVSYTANPVQIPSDFFYTANSSLKKELIEKAGYFDEDFSHDAWDDFEMSRRLSKVGAQSTFLTGVNCAHVHPQTLHERCAVMKLAGEAACVFDCKYEGVKSWHADLAHSPAWHRTKAMLGMAAYLVSGDRTVQHRYWKKLFAANFVEGYLKKLRAVVEI